MKKFIIFTFLLSLSGAAVQALSFKNESDTDAAVMVHTASHFDVEVGKKVSRIAKMQVGLAEWHPQNQRASVHCPTESNPIYITDAKTIILKGTNGDYTCTIE